MKHRIKQIYMFLSFFLICLLIAESAQAAQDTLVDDPPRATFVLGASDGRVALFAEDWVGPVFVFEKRLASLPEPDREALRAGIRITDAEELRRLLEAYIE